MRKPVSTLLIALASAQALAQTASPERLAECASIKDSKQRLACFDKETAPLAAPKPQTAPASSTRTPPPAAPAPAPRAPPPAAALPAPPPTPSLGEEQLSSKSKKSAPQNLEMHAHVSRQRDTGGGTFVIYLDNGQAWRHEEEYLGSLLVEGEAVTITKGTLGSYRLVRDAGSTKQWIRVSRIK